MSSMSLKITQDVIDKGVQHSSTKCMIALALGDKGARNVRVTAETAGFSLGGTHYLFSMPASAAARLKAFDENKAAVEPFIVRLQNGHTKPSQIRPRSTAAKTRAKRKKALAMRKAGKPLGEIADALGYKNPASVSCLLRRSSKTVRDREAIAGRATARRTNRRFDGLQVIEKPLAV